MVKPTRSCLHFPHHTAAGEHPFEGSTQFHGVSVPGYSPSWSPSKSGTQTKSTLRVMIGYGQVEAEGCPHVYTPKMDWLKGKGYG